MKRIPVAAMALLLILPAASAQLQQSFNSTYDWNNAPDHSGVTWDGIQDHAQQPTLQQGYQYGSLTEGLVGYWSFEQKRPKGPIDRALGNNGTFKGDNDGTLKNFEFNAESGWIEDAKRGSHALEFDGKDDKIKISKSSGVSNATSVTVSGWFRGEDKQKKFAKPVSTTHSNGNPGYEIAFMDEGGIVFFVNDGSIDGQGYSASADLVSRQWVHITGTYDESSGEQSLYVNGELKESNSLSIDSIASNDYLSIGARRLNNFEYDGAIDDLRIFDRSLSQSEISSLYEGQSVNRSGLVGEWTFDTGSGTTAHDTSNWKNGKLGRYSADFDGEDDWVDLAGSWGSVSADAWTVSAWLKDNNPDGNGADPWEKAVDMKSSSDGRDSLTLATRTTNYRFFWSGSQGSISHGPVKEGWNHLTGVVRQDGSGILYLNGNQVGTDTQAPSDTLTDGRIGRSFVSGEEWNGSIDGVRIYERALSAQEVKSLYNRNEREQRIGPQNTLQSGLVGWWPMHETSGGTASDLSGNNKDGSLNGGITQGVSGVGGSTAYSFDGSDDKVDIPNDFRGLDGSQDFTLSHWVKADDWDSTQKTFHFRGQRAIRFEHRPGTGDRISFLIYDGQNRITTSDRLRDGKWYHLTGVYESGDKMELWVDGEKVATNPVTSSIGAATVDNSIGNDGDGGQYFSGKIQDARLYSRALSKQEIDRLYQNGAGDYATPPTNNDGGVAYWSFDQADSDTRVVEDEWGNHDGVRGTKGGTDQPSITENGKRGKALGFDGSNDYVELQEIPKLEEYTYSVWAKSNGDLSGQSNRHVLNIDGNGQLFGVRFDDSPKDNWLFNHKLGDSNYVGGMTAEYRPGTWTHLTASWDGSEVSYYKNGQILGSKDANTISSTGRAFHIGQRGDNFGYFKGEIDEVRIYNRSLAKHEVYELYQHGTFGRDMRSLTENRGLVGYYSLDEDSGQTVYDLSGQGNSGTLGYTSSPESTDPTQGVKGVLGTSSFNFDDNEFVEISSPPFSQPNEFTIMSWFKPSVSASNQDDFAKIVSGVDAQNSDNNYLLQINSPAGGNYIGGGYHTGSDYRIVDSGFTPAKNKWVHAAVTYDGTNLKVFVDGEQLNSETYTSNPGEAETFKIGRGVSAEQTFQGEIDEVRIYNRSLTPSEIQSLYSTSQHGSITNEWDAGGPVKPQLTATDWNRPDAPGTSDLVGAWRLNEDHGLSSSGDTTSDWSGNGNDGTTKGGITTHVDGAYDGSKAYQFDGSDDYVKVSGNSDVALSRFTLSAWVYRENNNNFHAIIANDEGGKTSGGVNRNYWIGGERNRNCVHFKTDDLGDNNEGPDCAGTLPQKEWTHVTGVHTGDEGEMRVYINGNPVSTTSFSGTVNTENGPVGIGAELGDDEDYWSGKIDDVRIYDTALSKSSIKSLYHSSTVSADVIGGQGSEYGSRFSQEFPFPDGYEAGPGATEVSWDRPHSETMLNTVLSTPNITKAPSLSAAALNSPSYTETTTDQWNKGYKEGVASYRQGQYTDDQDGEIHLGQGRRSDSSLKAHYNFEPKNPGTVTDVSGNQNNGELIGNQKDGTLQNFDFNANSGWVSGKRGEHALKFDGNDDYVRVNDNGNLDGVEGSQSEFSVCSWFRWRGGEDIPRQSSIAHKGDDQAELPGPEVWRFMVDDGEGGDFIHYRDKSGNNVHSNQEVEPNQWTHACLNVDSGNNVEFYVNGILDNTASIDSIGSGESPLLIGEGIGAIDQHWNGEIDGFRLYNSTLSSSQVSDLYSGEDVRDDIIGEWTFDEGSGTVAHDTSRWTDGVRQGKALEFDGSDDEISIPNFDQFNAYTISYWTYPTNANGANQEHIDIRENNHLEVQHSSGTVTLYHDEPGNQETVSATLDNDAWQHFVWTWNGEEIYGYKDGELIGEASASGMEDDNNGPNYIGSQGNGEYFHGKFDSFRVYDRGFSKHEVSQLYNPSPGYWSSRFFDAGRPTRFTNLTWQEDLQQSTDAEARVQVAEQVNTTESFDDWNEGTGFWGHRKPITITEKSGSELTDFQVNLTIDTQTLISDGKMKDGCEDIRFWSRDNGVLDYWVEGACNTADTTIWVEVGSIPPSGTKTIYMYYGNGGADSQSDAEETMALYDGFSGSSLDESKWKSTGSPTVSNGNLILNSNNEWVTSYKMFNYSAVFETRVQAENEVYGTFGLIQDRSDSHFGDGHTEPAVDINFWNDKDGNPNPDSLFSERSDADGGSETQYSKYYWNTWYNATIKWEAGSFSKYKTCNATQCDSNTYDTTNNMPDADDGLRVILSNDDSSDLNFDWVFVRKYASTMPDVSVKSEEDVDSIKGFDSANTYTSQWYDWPGQTYNGPEPISRWEFSRGGGQIVKDIEGSNDGTLGSGSGYGNDDPTWKQNCRTDGCMEFDGADDGVSVSGTSVSTSHDMSWSAWFNADSTPNGINNIIDTRTGSYDTPIRLASQNSKIHCWMETTENNNNIFKLTISPSNPTDNWNQATCTYDSDTKTLKGYYNGDFEGEKSITGSSSSSVFAIGAQAETIDGEYFDGSIDDVRLYNTALTSSEVRSVLTSPKQPFASWQSRGGQVLKPLHHWTFDEGIGQKAYDSVGDNDGDLGGSTSSESSDPTWVSDCRSRGCLEFDGGDDYVDTGGVNITDDSITMAAWVKPDLASSDTWAGVIGGSSINGGGKEITLGQQLNGNGIWAEIQTTAGNEYVESGSMEQHSWNHILLRYDGSKLMSFLDGEHVASTSASGDLVGWMAPFPRIGDGQTNDHYFDGSIDDARIYNRSLSNASIHALYNAPSSSWSTSSVQVRTSAADPEDEDLVGSWSFEGTGQTVVDTSGNGNTGNLVADSNSPQRVSGYSGQGLKFDSNAPEYLNIPYSPSFDFEADSNPSFSQFIWVRFDDVSNTQRFVNQERTHLYWNNAGELTSRTGGTDLTYSWTPDEGTWHLLGMTYDESASGDNHKLWLDGEKVASREVSNLEDQTNVDLHIDDGSSRHKFTADEFRVYDKALSSDEVAELYQLSDFTPASRFNQGSYFDPNTTTLGGEEFDSQSLQYKVNILSGDSSSVPSVEKASVAQASGWTGFSSSAEGRNLSLSPERYGQVQFKLSSDNAASSPVLESFNFGVPSGPLNVNSYPVISSGDPHQDNVVGNDTSLSVNVSDPNNRNLSGEFINVTSGGVIDTFNISGDGRVSTNWNNLLRDRFYEWKVVVSDGILSTSESYNFTTYDVNLTWTDNSSVESGFRIYSNISGSGYEEIDTVPSNTESYLHDTSELGTGMNVCYRVSSFNSRGESDPVQTCFDTDNFIS